jgi:transcriptional regulator with XRE-family HTH domain
MTHDEGKNNLKEWLIGTPANPGLLKQRGMEVETLADKMGLQRATVYYFLNDTHRPSPESLAKMCQALHVDYTEGLKHVTPRVPGRPRQRAMTPVTPRRRRLQGVQL